MKVVANQRGLYGVIREPGEEFSIADKADLGSWMTPANDKEALAGIARQREPIGTPARAETGPNAAIASQYAEAGMQSTAILLELQDARVSLGQEKTRNAQLEAEIARLRAMVSPDAEQPPAKDADKATAAEAEKLQKAVEAAEEARADPHRSEDPDSVEATSPEARKEAEESRKAAEKANEEREAEAKEADKAETQSGRRRRLKD